MLIPAEDTPCLTNRRRHLVAEISRGEDILRAGKLDIWVLASACLSNQVFIYRAHRLTGKSVDSSGPPMRIARPAWGRPGRDAL
jgi:hypothetical protein